MRSETYSDVLGALGVKHYLNAELQSLARALCVDLNLVSDSSLVHVLGAGDEPSVERAVGTWIRWQLPELQRLARPQLLDELKSRLYRHLTLWELER